MLLCHTTNYSRLFHFTVLIPLLKSPSKLHLPDHHKTKPNPISHLFGFQCMELNSFPLLLTLLSCSKSHDAYGVPITRLPRYSTLDSTIISWAISLWHNKHKQLQEIKIKSNNVFTQVPQIAKQGNHKLATYGMLAGLLLNRYSFSKQYQCQVSWGTSNTQDRRQNNLNEPRSISIVH